MKKIFLLLSVVSFLLGCSTDSNEKMITAVYQTSVSGDQLKSIEPFTSSDEDILIEINPDEEFQKITGFGGAFTESSAYLLNQMGEVNRKNILQAYFSEEGANYSLTRTHMNSCDFSLDHYSYAPIEADLALDNFSIKEDMDDIVPMIKEAQLISKEGFKVLASPWTAPPWMKDNQDWYGGKLLKEHYPTWALFFSKYLKAYAQEGIDIWGVTVENEPLGNDSNWESMHYTPEEMGDFVKNHLGPKLEADSLDTKILVYDQNRGEELNEWVDVLLTDSALSPYIYGTAVHWYTSTVDWFPESLQYTHDLAPEKHIFHTEGCVDAEVPHWRDDAWYWSKEATDWGWDWAPEEDKKDHPKYVPAYRYARDIIGCLNNWVEGWIDWNMVLDTQGGPNLAKNWCVAPVIVDPEKDEVYYTPLYYVMSHFSKYIRPEAIRIGFTQSNDKLMITSVKNQDGSIVLVALNTSEDEKSVKLKIGDNSSFFKIDKQAVVTVIL
jgi:glucosylceramidase